MVTFLDRSSVCLVYVGMAAVVVVAAIVVVAAVIVMAAKHL